MHNLQRYMTGAGRIVRNFFLVALNICCPLLQVSGFRGALATLGNPLEVRNGASSMWNKPPVVMSKFMINGPFVVKNVSAHPKEKTREPGPGNQAEHTPTPNLMSSKTWAIISAPIRLFKLLNPNDLRNHLREDNHLPTKCHIVRIRDLEFTLGRS